MNALSLKERRSLRPTFIATVAMTVLTALTCNGSDAAGIVITAFTVGVLLMAASSFGNEFHTRTMLLLLAQPMPRERIWAEKMRELARELAASFVILMVALFFMVTGEGKLQGFPLIILGLAFISVCAFCSTPYYTLTIKNFFAAVAATVALPWGLVMIVMGMDWLISYLLNHPKLFLETFSDNHPALFWILVAVPAIAYCALFYRLGFRAFMAFQVVDSQSQEVRLPAPIERALAPWTEKIIPGYTSPFASLVRKELQLHRATFILVTLTLIIEPFLALAWKLHPSELFIGLMITPLAICAIGIPFVTGIVTVAEERNLGVTACQLTQPVSALKQWAAKILVSFSTCVVLGVVFPIAMTFLGEWVCGNSSTHAVPNDRYEFALFAFAYLALFSLIVYASTISPNPMRAMTAALGLLMAVGSALALAAYCANNLITYWLNIGFITVDQLSSQLDSWGRNFNLQPLNMMLAIVSGLGGLSFLFLIALLNRLSFANFRTVELNPRKTWKQISALLFFILIFALVLNALIVLANSLGSRLPAPQIKQTQLRP